MPIRITVDDIKVEVDSAEEFQAVAPFLTALRQGHLPSTNGHAAQGTSFAAPTAAVAAAQLVVPAAAPSTLMSVPQAPIEERLKSFMNVAQQAKSWVFLQALHQMGDDTPVDGADLAVLTQVDKNSVGGYWTGMNRIAESCGLTLEDVVEKTRRIANGRYVYSYRLTPAFRELLTKN